MARMQALQWGVFMIWNMLSWVKVFQRIDDADFQG